MNYYSKKTIIIEKNGKKTTTVEETSTDKKPETKKIDKVFKKFEDLMDDFKELF